MGITTLIAFVFAAWLIAASDRHPVSSSTATETPAESFGELPLSFVPNRGQTDARVRFEARLPGMSAFFAERKLVLALTRRDRAAALELRFIDASPQARLEPHARAAGRVNYPTGEARSQRTNLPTYRTLVYDDLWPGIDMAVRGSGGMLKYEFRVAAGADPSDIRLAYAGAEALSLSRAGAMTIRTPAGRLSDSRPSSFQRIGGRRVPVLSSFSLRGGTRYGFDLGRYDRRRPLVIDPGLEYATFLGGNSRDDGRAIAVDQDGSAYVTGSTASSDFPTTPGAFNRTRLFEDVYVTKLSPDGSNLVYSTYLGSGVANGIAVDSQGNAYVGGFTGGSFPTTPGAYDRTHNGGGLDAFVTKLNPDGSGLVYSTFIGGSGSETTFFGHSLALDPQGNTYVTGDTSSDDFPTTPGAFDTTFAAGSDPNGNPLFGMFVAKLNASGSALGYATYLVPGNGQTRLAGPSIAADGAGHAYVNGSAAAGLPTTPGVLGPTKTGAFDEAFVSKFAPDGSALDYSTYLPNVEFGLGIAVDGSNFAYVTGDAGPAFAATAGAYDPTFNGVRDVVALKLNQSGSALEWGTFVGGPGSEGGRGIALDRDGATHLTGIVEAPGFPTTEGAVQTGPSSTRFADAFYAKLSPGGTSLEYSTYMGGSEFDIGFAVASDASGNGYVVVDSESPDFLTTPGAYDTSFNGLKDVSVSKFQFGPGPPESTPGCSVTGGGRIVTSDGNKATFGGRAESGFDGTVDGSPTYVDHGPEKVRLRRASAEALVCDRDSATIFGRAELKGAAEVTFRIDVTDSGPGRSDTYRILLSNGYDSGVQRLRSGNLRVRQD